MRATFEASEFHDQLLQVESSDESELFLINHDGDPADTVPPVRRHFQGNPL
jgi:hypothetical protein